jgi:hypothetical protein
MPQPSHPTYNQWAVQTIMPAPGWRAVYYDRDTGKHWLSDLHALALAYRRTYECHTGVLIEPRISKSEDETWEIVGLEYEPKGIWGVCDDARNFCSLLPPGMTLEEFEEQCGCHHVNAKEGNATPREP